jgi:hypothetical protein
MSDVRVGIYHYKPPITPQDSPPVPAQANWGSDLSSLARSTDGIVASSAVGSLNWKSPSEGGEGDGVPLFGYPLYHATMLNAVKVRILEGAMTSSRAGGGSRSSMRARAEVSLVLALLLMPFPFITADGIAGAEGQQIRNGESPIAASQAVGSRLYGMPWNADGIGNLTIGHWNKRLSTRFRAVRNGELDKIKLYFIFATHLDQGSCTPTDCYGAGNGGRILIQLRPDDGTAAHRPSRKVLSSILIANPMNRRRGPPIYAMGSGYQGRAIVNFRVIDFRNTRLKKGHLYHLVFANTSSSPFANYVSLNYLYLRSSYARTQPAVSNIDFAALAWHSYEPGWRLQRHFTPILDIRYAGGFVQGQGYLDTRVSQPLPIYGNSRARERIISVRGGDRTVSAVAVRLRRVGDPGPLIIRLERGDGSRIGGGAVPSVQVPKSQRWVSFAFSRPRTLRMGRRYNVVLSASGDGSNNYLIYPLQQGNVRYGFASRNQFGSGYAQMNLGSGWLNTIPGWGTAATLDFQFYFRCASGRC